VGSPAAEAVRRLPGPPLEDPPTSPPRNSTGAPWGERGGTTGARAATFHGRRSSAADVPADLAQRLQRSRPKCLSRGVSAAGVPPRERSGRLARRPSRAGHSIAWVFSGPAPGLAGDRGGALTGAAPSGAQRSDLQAGQFAKRASFTRSVKESGPALPGHGKGPPRASAGIAGLTVLREGWQPVRVETLGL